MRCPGRRLRIVGLGVRSRIHCSIGRVGVGRVLLVARICVVVLVGMMISLARMVRIAWPARHGIVHGRRLLLLSLLLLLLLRWRRCSRTVRMTSSCAIMLLIVKRVADCDILSRVGRRIAGIVGVAIHGWRMRWRNSRRLERVLTVGGSSRRRNAKLPFGWLLLRRRFHLKIEIIEIIKKMLLMKRLQQWRLYLVEYWLRINSSSIKLALPRKETLRVVLAERVGRTGRGTNAQRLSNILP